MKALVLVDLQNDFCPGGALEVKRGDEVVAVANRLAPRFPLVVATQDWHPANHGSFAVHNPGRKPYELGELAGLPQVMWPVHCVAGTPGAAFHPALDLGKIDRVFPKGTDPAIDSYSGFFDNGKRKATGLGEFLRARGVDELMVLGLATDYCVRATCLDGVGLGFAVTLVEDGCRGVELQAGDTARAIAELRDAGVRVVHSEEVT
jgi:nicotinamidase/pyrazinamidase